MPSIFQISLLAYLIIINLVTVIAFGADKISSQSGAWRVRERTLFLFALIGGAVGALFAIHLFRHKNRKASFLFVIVAILLLQLAALFYSGFITIPTPALDTFETSV